MSKGIICNKCGKELDIWDKQEEFSLHKNLGYGTAYDGMRLELDLCCKCMEELIVNCAETPLIDISECECPTT